MPTYRSVTILLVEDDPGHARLIEKNMRRSNVTNDIVIATDGQQALDFIYSEGEYAGRTSPSPLLILLDLNLPVLDGYQVLERLKSDEHTQRIPIIILTSTQDPREVERCYELGCNIYVTKPVDYEQFSQAIAKIGLFLSVVTIPDEE
jgi:CheY-like chemotaxis protein